MEFKEVIKTRFSCRKYSGKKIEREKPLSDTVSWR